jgi:hypothetical protein
MRMLLNLPTYNAQGNLGAAMYVCRKLRIPKTKWTNYARSSKAPCPQLLSLYSPPSLY